MTEIEVLQKMCSDLEKYDVNYKVEPYSKTLMRLTDGTKSLYGNTKQIFAHLVQVGGWLYNESQRKTTESS